MTLENQTLILILAFSLLLSYPAEAHLAPSPKAGGGGNKNSQKIADELKALIPKGAEHLKLIKNRIDETPLSSPSEKCLDSCLSTYEKEIMDLRKFAEYLSSGTTKEIDFDMTVEKAELDKCDACLRQVAKEDPEFNRYAAWFFKTTEKVGELIDKYNS